MNVFERPRAQTLLDECKRALASNKIHLKPHSKTIFVCGSKESNSQRDQFLIFSKNHLPQFQILLAETVAHELNEDGTEKYFNMLDFEKKLSSAADCLIIFPESPGSFAELGYFSAQDTLRNKIFVVNSHEFQNNSFVNRGPIDLIEVSTRFKKISINKVGIEWQFGSVKQILEESLPHKRGHYMTSNYKDLSYKEKMFLTLLLIKIFPALDQTKLLHIFIYLFGNGNYVADIRFCTSILVASGYIKRSTTTPIFVYSNGDKDDIIEIKGFDHSAFRLKAIDLFRIEDLPFLERWREHAT